MLIWTKVIAERWQFMAVYRPARDRVHDATLPACMNSQTVTATALSSVLNSYDWSMRATCLLLCAGSVKQVLQPVPGCLSCQAAQSLWLPQPAGSSRHLQRAAAEHVNLLKLLAVICRVICKLDLICWVSAHAQQAVHAEVLTLGMQQQDERTPADMYT